MKNAFLEVKLLWLPVTGKDSFQGKARAISSKNHLGKFDILPNHTNFISLIFDTLTLYLPRGKINYKFKRGVLEVSDNKVRIFLGL